MWRMFFGGRDFVPTLHLTTRPECETFDGEQPIGNVVGELSRIAPAPASQTILGVDKFACYEHLRRPTKNTKSRGRTN